MRRSQRRPARRYRLRRTRDKVEVFLEMILSSHQQNNLTPALHHQQLHLLTLIKGV